MRQPRLGRRVFSLALRKAASPRTRRSLALLALALLAIYVLVRLTRFLVFSALAFSRRGPAFEPCSPSDPGMHPDRLFLDGAHCIPSFQADGSPEIINFLAAPSLSNNAFIDCTTPQAVRLLTASDGGDKYFKLMLNLIASVQFWEPQMPITVYDMGFSAQQRRQVEGLRNVELRVFPFDLLPAHVRDLSSYAFKGLAWLDATRFVREECLLWQDAGQEFRNPLSRIRKKMTNEGVFLGSSSAAWPAKRTYAGILDFFGVDLDIVSRVMADRTARNESGREAAAGIFGWTRRPAIVRALILPMATCSLLKPCILPPGASKETSLQDQTVFNTILYVRRWPGEPVPPERMVGKYIAASMAPDPEIVWRRPPNARVDPKQPSDKFEVTNRKRDKSGALPYLSMLQARDT